MPLNPVQIAHLDDFRMGQEDVIRAWDKLNTFVLNLDAFAATPDSLPLTGPLDDENPGKPGLTGAEVTALRNIAANMRDQISPAAFDLVVGKMTRSLRAVTRG